MPIAQVPILHAGFLLGMNPFCRVIITDVGEYITLKAGAPLLQVLALPSLLAPLGVLSTGIAMQKSLVLPLPPGDRQDLQFPNVLAIMASPDSKSSTDIDMISWVTRT